MVKQDYGAESIRVLEGLEGVRKRPAMYIGSTGKEGLHHLVYEIVDNSVDEALAGYCKQIKVTINSAGSVTVIDDGRGIPVDIHPQLKIPAVQVALTKLHAGGKFDKKSYMISGGLHGVGISVVNALSKKLIVEIKRDGKIHKQEYSRGIAKNKLTVIGQVPKNKTGTKVTFWPDEEIFTVLKFDHAVLETRFREMAFLNAGLKINLENVDKKIKQEFFYSGGLIEFVKWVNKSKDIIHKPIYFKRDIQDIHIEIAIQYNTSFRETIFGFVNTINTIEGGTHVSGFKTALTRVINDYAKKTGALKSGKSGGESFTGEDIREGLTAIISVKIPEPQFEGQTKTKLGNSEVKGYVDSIVTSSLTEFFEENPAVAKKIVSKLKTNNNIIIVSFHGGAEGKNALHVPDSIEIMYGENRGNVKEFAHSVIDAGADLVLGHGPHILRALELYKDRLIAYSLGNFLTYGNMNIKGVSGIAGILEIKLDGNNGKFQSGNFISTKQVGKGYPVIDNSKKAIKLLKKLTETDFPKTNLVIKSNGSIIIKPPPGGL